MCFYSQQPSLAGLDIDCGTRYPAMNRWAIFGCPYGTPAFGKLPSYTTQLPYHQPLETPVNTLLSPTATEACSCLHSGFCAVFCIGCAGRIGLQSGGFLGAPGLVKPQWIEELKQMHHRSHRSYVLGFGVLILTLFSLKLCANTVHAGDLPLKHGMMPSYAT